MRALLDVNVLVALLDQDHVHHGRARDWLVEREASGWSSCPLTQNGCIRVMSQEGYPNTLTAGAVVERLALAAAHPSHAFWPADITLLDPAVADRSRIHGPRQVTDLYLLALAAKHGGCFATFDGSVTVSAVHGAGREHLVVI
jgi:toxin-antitoxin system PIN domain toxin